MWTPLEKFSRLTRWLTDPKTFPLFIPYISHPLKFSFDFIYTHTIEVAVLIEVKYQILLTKQPFSDSVQNESWN